MRVIVGRPMTEGELAEALGVSRRRVRAILEVHRIRPSFCIGRRRTRCYTPAQIEALYALMGSN